MNGMVQWVEKFRLRVIPEDTMLVRGSSEVT
jgi:hypothetical protein